MRSQAALVKNPRPEIIPMAPWRVVEVHALPEFRLRVCFRDGVAGYVDMAGMILGKDAGVFSCLRDPEIFRQVYLEYGAVTWPGEIDLAPDTMHDAIKARGEWVPA